MELRRTRSSAPVVPVASRYNANGELEIGTVPFKPNTLIKRCGKYYLIDKHGTQRRVK